MQNRRKVLRLQIAGGSERQKCVGLCVVFVISPFCLFGQVRIESYTDSRDGKSYEVSQIGEQVWMAGNIGYVADESWCYNDSLSCQNSGRLYTYKAALEACPAGWHLPTDEDWQTLEKHVGVFPDQLQKTGPRGHTGTRLLVGGDTGFNAAACGYRRPDGNYVRVEERTAFWAATEFNDDEAWHRDLRPNTETIYRSPVTKTYALSVRCIKD